MHELSTSTRPAALLRISGATLAFALAATLPRAAAAQPPDPALIARIGHQIDALDDLGKRASFHEESLIEEVDSDGKVASTETRVSHVDADGKNAHETLEKCIRDGKDVTAEERAKAEKEAKKEEKEKAEKKGEVSLNIDAPFSSTSDNYVYDQIGTDPADPTHVEISFTPKKPSSKTVEGKAWVDTVSGTILTAGAKLSKPPTFVDWIHFTVEFNAKTPLGPAMSKLGFEAKGGFLFLIRKHFRGEVKMTDYRITP
ncbi:MAG: hypothetical protein ACLQVI_15710 [Polyangiaceae bacterium]|jgi:hypothetical protein